MRFLEIADDDSGDNTTVDSAKIVTALSVIQNRIKDQNLSPEVPVQVVLRFIQNTGIPGFSHEDLINANESDSAIKHLIKNITQDHVTFATSSAQAVNNPDDYDSAATNPEQTVSNMAKSAMKRRQK